MPGTSPNQQKKSSTFNIVEKLASTVNACANHLLSKIAEYKKTDLEVKVELVHEMRKAIKRGNQNLAVYNQLASRLESVPCLLVFIKQQGKKIMPQLRKEKSCIIPCDDLSNYSDAHSLEDYYMALGYYQNRESIFQQATADLNSKCQHDLQNVATNTATTLSDFNPGFG
jgi:hypothetical protein